MSIFENRFQSFRIRILEGCLRSRAWTKKDLLDYLNEKIEEDFDADKTVGERTFNEDLKKIKDRLELDDATIQSKRIGTSVYYEYSNKDLSVFDEALSKQDIGKLVKAIAVIDQIQGVELNKGLSEVIQKLDTQIRYSKSKEVPVISFQNETVADGYEHLSPIYNAIVEKCVLSFHYKPFNDLEILKMVHPYYLKQYNNRWFLFGYVLSNSRVEVFALDRIFDSIRYEKKERYLEPEDFFNPEAYFKDIIGVTRFDPLEKQTIKINIAASSAPYVRTKKWHHSQEIIDTATDGSITIQLQLIPNRELKQLILSFGAAARVLEPKTLVNELKQETKLMSAAYRSTA